MKALLTVGSTEFDALVRAGLAPETLAAFKELGVQSLRVQLGHSALPLGYTVDHADTPVVIQGIRVQCVRFISNLEEEVGQYNLVISHAGALTCYPPLSFLLPCTS